MSSLKKRMAQLAKSAPQEYDVDAADTFDDGTRAVDAAGRAVLDEDMQLGAPQFRADIDMGDDPRYAGVATSRKALRRQRGEESEDEVDEDGSESSDEDMGVEIDEVSEASSDEEPGTTTQSRVETEDIEAELEALEKSDQQVLMKKSNAANAAEQAAHTRNQIELWERTLEVRIRMQKSLVMAHKLPRRRRNEFVQGTEEAGPQLSQASAAACELLDTLHTLQRELVAQSSCFDDMDSSDEEQDNDPVEYHWGKIQSTWTSLEPTMVDIVSQWQRRLLFQSGLSAKKQLKVVNQDIRKQTDAVLENRSVMLQRSQVVRTPSLRELGTDSSADATGEGDPHTYEDPDFYQQLLNEFIKTRKKADAGGFSVARRKSSKRKNVDRKASKGRKLRFQPHPKLVNFMAPLPAPAPPLDLDSLHASMFKSRS